MRKRVNKVILLLVLMALLLVGCSNDVSASDERFVTISREISGKVLYDRETNVEYWMSCGGYNVGTLTMLVDAEGNPLLYQGR